MFAFKDAILLRGACTTLLINNSMSDKKRLERNTCKSHAIVRTNGLNVFMELDDNHFKESHENGRSLRFMRNKVSSCGSTIVIYNGDHVLIVAETGMIIWTPEIHENEFKN